MKHGSVERALGAVLTFLAALGPAHAAAPAAPGTPAVHTAPQTTLPLNDILRGEWDISLGAGADGLPYESRIPYKNVYPSWSSGPPALYAAHLSHDEDPRNGVTVSAVLTDPNGNTHTWPCWYGEDMDGGGNPLGYAGWHLTYPAKTLGAWTGHLTVTDAGGTATGPAFGFTVAGSLTIPDAAKGRLSVSTADPRYLRYDDGDAYMPLGETANGMGQFASHLAAAAAAHVRMLIRTWCSRFGGCYPVTGGPDAAGADTQGDAAGITSQASHSGRYSYKITNGGGGELDANAANDHFVIPGSPSGIQRFGFWVRAVNGATGSVGMAVYAGANTLKTTDEAGADIHDGAWHYVQGTYAGGTAPATISLDVSGNTSASGYWLFDDLCITDSAHDPAAGPGSAWDLLGGAGAFELQNTLDQSSCAGLSATLDQCRRDDADLLIEFYSCTDKVQGSIDPTGANLGPDVNTATAPGAVPAYQAGQYAAYPSVMGPKSASDDGTQTCVGLLHAQQVRDWVARFGAYIGQGVAYVAYANEINTSGDDSGPDHWAVQMRSVTPDCQPVCGVDTSWNSGGSPWVDAQYESPWLQFAEPHVPVGSAPSPVGAYYFNVPYSLNANLGLSNGTRRATGGPLGGGYFEYPAGAVCPNPGIQLPDFTVPGQWTFSCYAETVTDAQGRPFATTHGATGLYVELPGNGVGVLSVPPTGLASWTRLTNTFSLSAGAAPSLSPSVNFNNGQTGGDVRYGDITLTDPNGRVFFRDDFNEPLLDSGAGDAVSVYGETYDVGASGEAGAGRPVVIGESESYGPVSNTTTGPGGTYTTNSNAYPMAQFALRAALSMADARWHADTQWYEDSLVVDAGGYGAPFHTMQSLLDGFFAPDGSWREAPTAQSGFAGPGVPFAVYGQENNRVPMTGATVAATRAVLSVLPLQPDPTTPHAFLPGTGVVDLQGLADAPYTVQEYDGASGRLTVTLTATSAGGHLPLNFIALASGAVVKVSPTAAPALTVQLAADHATARPGDVVTYKLTYTNTGTGPALAVTVPWAIPAHMQFLSASGGTYDSAANVVNWSLGTLAPGASGSVVLKARVE